MARLKTPQTTAIHRLFDDVPFTEVVQRAWFCHTDF